MVAMQATQGNTGERVEKAEEAVRCGTWKIIFAGCPDCL
jgi:hypothetical protein